MNPAHIYSTRNIIFVYLSLEVKLFSLRWRFFYLFQVIALFFIVREFEMGKQIEIR